MNINELKIEVTKALERNMTMTEQVDFANFCKSEVHRLFTSYIDEGHENAKNSDTPEERENHHKEIHHVGEMLSQLK